MDVVLAYTGGGSWNSGTDTSPMGLAFKALPFVVIAVAAISWLWRRRRKSRNRPFDGGPVTGRPFDGPVQSRVVVNTPPRVVYNQGSSAQPMDAQGIAELFSAMGAPVNTTELADHLRQSSGSASVLSASELLATGQRVSAVLKSFSPTGTTPRSLGRTPSRPDLIDAPHYMFEVELRFPNLAPIIGKSIQLVPQSQVSRLSIGSMLTCAVDPADPAHRFVVDWTQI